MAMNDTDNRPDRGPGDPASEGTEPEQQFPGAGTDDESTGGGGQPERRDPIDGDSSDVVDGPIGSASLVEPTTVEEEGLSADLG
ncbi:MAG: hypothetical protein QOF11_1914 [Chloroflexota bacterium]|jgi:hypothetical protein|nr:hypothetical protein [Chloroflexota bacterium]